MKNKRLCTALILQAFLLLVEILSNVAMFLSIGTQTFTYYTTDSNILAGVTAVIFIVYAVKSLKTGAPLPTWLPLVMLMTTGGLALTFLVALFILAPAMGGVVGMMLSGNMLFMHTLCPIVATVCYLFFIPEQKLTLTRLLWCEAFTFVYGTIAITLNILKVWNGPYPFLKVYEQSVLTSLVWVVVIFGGCYGIFYGLNRLGCLIEKRINK